MIVTSIVLWTAVAALVVFAYYVRFVEATALRVERVEVAIRDLPPQLAGLRIVHLSDLHLRNRPRALDLGLRAIELAMAEEADLICVTGDIGHRSWHISQAVKVMAPLDAEYGVYAVLGNHDLDRSLELNTFRENVDLDTVQRWVEGMETIGVDVLFNEHRRIAVNGHMLAVAGVGDPSCGFDNLSAALADAPLADVRILLSHSPDVFDEPGAEWAHLILCGHTHGGQIRLPLIGSPWAPVWRGRDRACGLMRVGPDTVAYVSRGSGAGTAARFHCPPEVTVLTLVQGCTDGLRVVR